MRKTYNERIRELREDHDYTQAYICLLYTSVSAVANGGNLMKPYLVKQLIDDDGNIVKTTEPTVVRQVISKETSDTVRMLLENAVTNGSGQNAYIKGYRVAGKTGTSEKIPRGNGKYIASFVGFAPANDPKVACLVMLDEPSNGEYYGGRIAAPVVGKIMEDTLPVSYTHLDVYKRQGHIC